MKVLFTVWPYSGHVNPCLAVALALRERGHEVGFYTGAGAGSAVEAEGFRRFAPRALARSVAGLVGSAEPADHPELYQRLSKKYTNLGAGSALERLKHIQTFYLENIIGTIPSQIEDLRAVLGEFQPDAIVTDAFLWGPVLILKETQPAPVAILSFYGGCLVPGPGAGPAGLGLPSPRNWYRRGVSNAVSWITRRATVVVRRATDDMRRRYNLAPLGRPFFANAAGVPLHMVTCSPEYDYSRQDLPAAVRYVGPCLYHPPIQAQRWRERLDPARPVIYVSEGTCQMEEPVLLKAAVKGLAGSAYQVVISTGTHRRFSAEQLGPAADNVMVEPWVSHSELFPLISAVVTNGGSGTVRGALQDGAPLVVVPMEWDQLENAQRIAEAGAGIRLHLRHCTAARVRAAVDSVVRNPDFKRNAQRLAASFERYGNGREAARLIEGLAASRPVAVPA